MNNKRPSLDELKYIGFIPDKLKFRLYEKKINCKGNYN